MPGPAGDRTLVSRMLAGEELAYRQCYEAHAPVVLRTLWRMLKSRAVAEDVLQESFAAAFRELGGFRGDARLSTWITGIAVRRALNHIRGESRRVKNLEAPEPEVSESPEGWLADRDLTRKLLSVLEEMDPEKRLALVLQSEGYTASEIAEMTHEPRGTVLSRLARARAELAERAGAAGLSTAEGFAREKVR